MTTGAAYLRIRRQKARRLLEERVEGIETEQRNGGEEIAVVNSETDAWLATLEPCEGAAEPAVDLSFTPRTHGEYRTDTAETETTKLRQIKDRLTGAASEWRW